VEGKRSVSVTPSHKKSASNAIPVAHSHPSSAAQDSEQDILNGLEGVTNIEVDMDEEDFSPLSSPSAVTSRSAFN
jgi:hypothetical protein